MNVKCHGCRFGFHFVQNIKKLKRAQILSSERFCRIFHWRVSDWATCPIFWRQTPRTMVVSLMWGLKWGMRNCIGKGLYLRQMLKTFISDFRQRLKLRFLFRSVISSNLDCLDLCIKENEAPLSLS